MFMRQLRTSRLDLLTVDDA